VRTIVGAAVLVLLCFGGTAMTLVIFFMTGRVADEIAGKQPQKDAVAQEAGDENEGPKPATGQGGPLQNLPRVEGSTTSPNTQPTPEILTLGYFGLAWLLPNRAGLDVEAEAVVGLYQRPVQGVQFGA
jgi:hypothetical protein